MEEPIEQLEQEITLTLQAIDSNFATATEEAAKLIGAVKTYNQNMKSVHAASQVWIDFLSNFGGPSRKALAGLLGDDNDSIIEEDKENSIVHENHASKSGDAPVGDLSMISQASMIAANLVGQVNAAVTPGPVPKIGVELSTPQGSAKGSRSPLMDTPSFGSSPPVTINPLGMTGALSPITPGLKGPEEDVVNEDDTMSDSFYNVDQQPAPEFNLASFPEAFQDDVGALQLTEVYSQFFGEEMPQLKSKSGKPIRAALGLEDLKTTLDGYEDEQLLLLLDQLTSRGLLRIIKVNNVLYWQRIGC